MTGRPPKAASRGGRAAAGAGPKVSLTPALRQYFEAKRECPGCVLFFQMGDFYELFFEDALLAAPLLDLALTSRQRLADKPVPLCGVPLQSVEGYINRLVALGHKVAVCDQSGAPGPGGGPAERRLARLVTPATVLSAEGQNPALPRYLAAAMRRDDEHVLAAVDISTGDFAVGHFTDFQTFRTALRNLEPAEILLPGTGLENPGGPAGGRDAPSEFKGGAGRDGTDAPAGPPAPAAAKEPPKTAAGAAASAAADSPGPATLADLNFYGGDAPPDRGASGDALPDAGPDGGGPERDDPAPPPGAGGPAAGREGPWPEGALISREMLDLARSLDALTTFVPAGDFDPAAGERELALAFPAGRGDRSVSAVSSAAFSSSVSADSSASSSSSSAASAASSSSASVFPARPPALSGGAATGARVVGEAPPLEGWPLLQGAAGAALRYLGNVTRGWGIRHLSQPRFLWERDYLHLDEAAVRNLELFKSLRDGGEKTTLLSQIDHTVTPMGARMLRDWLARPLIRLETVAARHEAVGELAGNTLLRQDLTRALARCGDLERSLGRLALGRGLVRDLVVVRRALELAPGVKEALLGAESPSLVTLGAKLDPLAALFRRVRATLADDQPAGGGASGLVRPGVSPALDELRNLESGGRGEIASLEAKERARTGIASLKIGFNRVFGYYLEVTKTNLRNVPADWTRKQTVANGERFVTEELKLWEERILSAGERREKLEERVVNHLKTTVAGETPGLKNLAAILAEADSLCSLAAAAESRGWTRPTLTAADLIDITGGRHPVVERFLPPGETFVANDTRLSPSERLLVITGPNMAGKSTVLRQTALIVILNQMGSFVPAERATLSMRDQVFTRVGASDDLAGGRSTFMVEMTETARILTSATHRSLVVLDEVGRGTSTYDGVAIAWAVAECLHDLGGRGAPTLFATHYHELTELPRHKACARNFNVSAKRWGGTVIFLRKLTPGGVSRSYGLDVAALAGVPPAVVKRARQVLADLGKISPGLVRAEHLRGSLFDRGNLSQDAPASLAREISQINVTELTPVAALNLLVDLRNRAREVLS